jgi:NAD(P)H dehydrogenase (quinone)
MHILTVYAHPNPKSFCHAVLERFTAGLKDAGHTFEIIDLYAIRFDPVFSMRDYAGYVHENMPLEVLESMNLKQRILENSGGPIQRFIASHWLRGKDVKAMARLIRSQMPRDIVNHQKKIAQAQGLAFIAPVFWCHFPAILKGWFERVFNYGFAYELKLEGWNNGKVSGRVPLLQHEKALVITPTIFNEDDYQKAGLERAMKTLIDDWGLRYPGIRKVEHIYFYHVDNATSQSYLERAYKLGKEFSNE